MVGTVCLEPASPKAAPLRCLLTFQASLSSAFRTREAKRSCSGPAENEDCGSLGSTSPGWLQMRCSLSRMLSTSTKCPPFRASWVLPQETQHSASAPLTPQTRHEHITSDLLRYVATPEPQLPPGSLGPSGFFLHCPHEKGQEAREPGVRVRCGHSSLGPHPDWKWMYFFKILIQGYVH